MGFTILDEVPVDPDTARVYEEGWQSWSPTQVHGVHDTSPRPAVEWQHLMRFRPGVELPERGFHAEGLLAVDPGAGEPVRLYAATDPTSGVPSIRATVSDSTVTVSSDRPEQVTITTSATIGSALTAYGDAERERAGLTLRRVPSVWCTWYDYFLDVTQDDVVENLEAIARLDLPVEVVQVDDGWQAAVGDWLELSPRFTSLRELAERIRDTGRRPGIWVAPFVVAEHSDLAARRPEWLVGDAGTNWDGTLLGVDLTHPAARSYLRQVFEELRLAGFDYYKLDFIYAGALPTQRHDPVTPEQAYRSGLQLIREAVGPDAYLLGCGAPILPSVGLVDAMRVSPDTYNPVMGDRPEDLRGRAGVEARAWQQGRFWVNDADCLVARPAFPRREEWAGVVERYSGLRAFSDRISSLDEWGLEAVRRLLGSVPEPVPFAELPVDYRS